MHICWNTPCWSLLSRPTERITGRSLPSCGCAATSCRPSTGRSVWCWCYFISPRPSIPSTTTFSFCALRSTSVFVVLPWPGWDPTWAGGTQSVRIRNTTSQSQPVRHGVPQGSAVGSVLFTVYSAPIAAIARQNGLGVRLYADNIHLYLTFGTSDGPVSISHIEACLLCIRRWMADNKLKLNDDKTLALLLTAPSLGPQPDISGLTIGNTSISCSASAHNVGAIFGQHLSMGAHVRSVCSSAFYHPHHIGRIHDVLDIKAAVKSSRPSSSPAWTVVTHCCTNCHLHSSGGCSECRRRLPEWWPGQVDGPSTSNRCFSSSTGFPCSTASPSRSCF